MFKFTENQLVSIENNNKLVVVSASAGSGKTSVMVEKVMKLLTNNIDANNLLIITFTKNSTLEMKNRISKKIVYNYQLKHNADSVDDLSICTIDSFCVDMIKKFTNNKHFRILSENENLEIIYTIIHKNINIIYKENDLNIINLMNQFNDSYDNKNFIQFIINQLLFISNLKDKKIFLDEIALNTDLKIAFLSKYIKLDLDCISDFLLKAIDLCQSSSELNEKYLPIIKSNFELLYKFQSLDTVELIIKIQNFNFIKLKPAKQSNLKLYVQSVIKYAKSIINDIKIIDINTKTIKDELVYFVDLIKKIDTEIDEYKHKYSVFNFSDIEIMLLNLLKNNPTIKEKIHQKYKYILVDEYQDVNEIQNSIFDLISENLFVVGDYKQSIYGFRGAIPEAFHNKKKYAFSIDLNENFRSNDHILKFINDCFSQIMTEKTNLIDYNKTEKFKLKNNIMSEANDKIHFYLLDVKSEWKKIVHEIEFVADIINQSISSKKQIYGRNIQLSDFCILVRNYNKYSDTIYKIFKNKKIKIKSNGLNDLLNYDEIYNLILLLECVVNPLDDINLSALLMGPIFNFSNFELAKIRGFNDENEFYFSMKKYCFEHDDIIGKKCKLFFDFLNQAEYQYKQKSLSEFVFFVIDEIESTLCSHYKIDNSNFLKFLYLAQKFAKENFSKNIQKLIDYIKNQTYDVLEDVFEMDDAVSVTSIHKAKGKEYPICFLIGCGDKFLKKCDAVMCDAELGISFKSNTQKLSIDRYCMEAAYKYKTIAEEMRLLYVALTRAKEELHIILSSYNAEQDLEKASLNANMFENIHPYFIRNSKNFYEWFLMIHFKFEEYNFTKIDFFDKSD